MNGQSPNVVIIISDQQRADTMPGDRANDICTPHLDRLAESSVQFRRGYCTFPMCSPSRSSILSGLYPHGTRMVSNHQPRPVSDELHLPQDVKLVADYLKTKDYLCAYTGKWHLGTGGDRRGFTDHVTRTSMYDVDGPNQNDMLGFTRKAGIPIAMKESGIDPNPTTFDKRTRIGTSLLPLSYHSSVRNALSAAGFIRRAAAEGRRFCLTYSCHEPHPAFVSPFPFDRSHDRRSMVLPRNVSDRNGYEIMRHRVDWQLKSSAGFHEEELQSMWAAYCGAVSYVDHCLGTVLEALTDTEQMDETLLIFTSDHGEMLGSHGMLFKGSVLYEELVRIPLLIRPPGGLNGPHETQCLVSQVDLVPTILDWCGVDDPGDLHGRSLRGLSEGQDEVANRGIGLEYHSSNWGEQPCPLRGWLTEEWKYIEGVEGPQELFHLATDPDETDNKVSDPGAADALKDMKQGLNEWLMETDDPWPKVPMPDPDRIVPKESGGLWKI